MSVTRGASLSVLSALATAWAGALVVAGLALLTGSMGRWAMLGWGGVIGGITIIAGGQLVFMALVADRLFPAAARGVIGWIEVATCLVVFAGAVLIVLALLMP
jgi:hypothetical protein